MTAAQISEALGGRRSGRGYRAPCPGHPDKHPSLDLVDRDGTVLFVDRSGRCTQREVLLALRGLGLWHSESQKHAPHEPVDWQFRDPVIPTAKQQRQFTTDFLVATLFANLREAADELRGKAARGLDYLLESRDPAKPFEAGELRAGLGFAIEFGAIVPPGLSPGIVQRTIDLVCGGGR